MMAKKNVARQIGRTPEYVFFFRRKGLKIALSGRESKSLLVILRFLIKYIGDYRFTRILIDVSNILLGKYYQIDCNFSAVYKCWCPGVFISKNNSDSNCDFVWKM